MEATIHERRLRFPTMAEIKDTVQNVRTDARTLWLPLGTILVVLLGFSGALLGAGMWIQKTNEKAATTTELATSLKDVNDSIKTMQGSINALMTMQSTLAETRAEVGGLDSRLDALEIKLQTQDAWIQRLRDDLRRQGVEPPPYNYGGK